MWGIGILTWNDPAVCLETLRSLIAGLSLRPGDQIVVLDNGSDVPLTVDEWPVIVLREPANRGAGAGLSALVSGMLRLQVDHLLCLEDDWRLERPMATVDLEPLVDDPAVGQVRLALRRDQAPMNYYTHGLTGADADAALIASHSPLFPYTSGHYQRIRSLWSNNPFACRRDVAERFLLTGWNELRMAWPYYNSGLTTISTTPGHFCHLGSIRDRREKAGWTK